jgi:hypothetical protein
MLLESATKPKIKDKVRRELSKRAPVVAPA